MDFGAAVRGGGEQFERAAAVGLRAVAAAVRGGHGVGGGSEPELVGYPRGLSLRDGGRRGRIDPQQLLGKRTSGLSGEPYGSAPTQSVGLLR